MFLNIFSDSSQSILHLMIGGHCDGQFNILRFDLRCEITWPPWPLIVFYWYIVPCTCAVSGRKPMLKYLKPWVPQELSKMPRDPRLEGTLQMSFIVWFLINTVQIMCNFFGCRGKYNQCGSSALALYKFFWNSSKSNHQLYQIVNSTKRLKQTS